MAILKDLRNVSSTTAEAREPLGGDVKEIFIRNDGPQTARFRFEFSDGSATTSYEEIEKDAEFREEVPTGTVDLVLIHRSTSATSTLAVRTFR